VRCPRFDGFGLGAILITIAPRLLKPLEPKHHCDWTLWEEKTINIHRGVIELTAPSGCSIDELAREVREGVREEYRPGWFRGFGFGTIVHFADVPGDFTQYCRHVDTRNKRHGVWQWAIACLDDEQIAIGVHTWLHGYLRPVYDATRQQLTHSGFQCHSSDADVDALIARLQVLGQTCRALQQITGIAT
jgi:hypothetical protein